MILVFKPKIIRKSSKSDIAIVWIDIWDVQSSTKAKSLINKYFNIERYITIIWSTNMNLEILQCKNCWKCEHTMFSCWTHRVRCIKCNGLHKVKYYRNLVWYCKLNFKTNLLRLETPKNILYSHTFKCNNCKEKYQADSYLCPFWKHWFNKKWHLKKY